MEKFSVGMDIRKVVTAKNMNEFVGVVNWIKENSGPVSNWNGTFSGFKGGEIRVKFDGEESLDMFSAVALTDLELTPENCDTFKSETPTFNAEPFAEDSDLPFAILLEPANPGEIAKAVMIGITPAKVTIQNATHGFAKPTADGDGTLESCETGTAKILWKAGESGEQWCVLQLGIGSDGAEPEDYAFKLIPGGGGTEPPYLMMKSGSVEIQTDTSDYALFRYGECDSFSDDEIIDFDFSSADEDEYLVIGWIKYGSGNTECGILIGKNSEVNTTEGTPFGCGFFTFPIGVVKVSYPEENEDDNESYPTITVQKQIAAGFFTITDNYYNLPFVPYIDVNVPDTDELFTQNSIVATRAHIPNAPVYMDEMQTFTNFQNNGTSLAKGGKYYAYIIDVGGDVELFWSDQSPAVYEEDEDENKIKRVIVAELDYNQNGTIKTSLYHLAAYHSTRRAEETEVEITSPKNTILISTPEDDDSETGVNKKQLDVNFEKFESEDKTVGIKIKDGGAKVDFRVMNSGKVKVNMDDENPDFLAEKIVSPNNTIEISVSEDNTTLQLETTSMEIDRHAQWLLEHNQDGKLDTTIGGPPSSGEYYLGANNGTLEWQTGASGHETYMVRINDEDWPPDFIESKIIGDEVEQGDAEKYEDTKGFIKHLVVEVEDEEEGNNSGEENEEEDDRKNLALKTVWDYKGIPKFYEHETPMTLIAKDGGNNNDPKLEWESYGKIRTEDADKNPGFMKDKFEAGPGVSFSWTGNKLKVSVSSVEIDQHAQWLLEHNQDGKIDTTIGGPPSSGKYYLGANNGTLGWQTGGESSGGGGADTYDGPFAVTYNEQTGQINVAAGYLNANGEWMNVSAKNLSPQNGIICVNSTISEWSWSTPDIKFATPDKNNYPIGKCKIENGEVKVSSFHVPVAIIIDTLSCPYENLGIDSGDDNTAEPM